MTKVKQKTVSKGKLKAKMLEYFREVESSGETLIVTNNNVPVLEVRPIKKKLSPELVFADLRGKVKYHEEIEAPTQAEWRDVD